MCFRCGRNERLATDCPATMANASSGGDDEVWPDNFVEMENGGSSQEKLSVKACHLILGRAKPPNDLYGP